VLQFTNNNNAVHQDFLPSWNYDQATSCRVHNFDRIAYQLLSVIFGTVLDLLFLIAQGHTQGLVVV